MFARLAGCWRVVVVAALALVAAAPPDRTPLERRVEELIKKLGAGEYATRKSAEKELTELGKLAVPQLFQSALKEDDLERSFRLRRILSDASPVHHQRVLRHLRRPEVLAEIRK